MKMKMIRSMDHDEKTLDYAGDATYIGRVVHGEGRGSPMGVHWKGSLADLIARGLARNLEGGALLARANCGHVRKIK